MYVRYRRQVFKQWWGSHFQIVQFHDHPYTVPRDERFCLLLTIHLVQGSCAQFSPKYIIQTGFFFPFLSLLYFKKKNVRYLTWYLFVSLLFFAPSLYFFILNWFVNFVLQLNESAEMGCWWISLDSSQHCSEIKSQYALMGHSIIGKALLPGSNHNHLATPYIWKEHD